MQKPNIIFIVVDALRYSNLGYYNDRKVTPNIDNLAKKGIMFKNAFSSINFTDPSVTSIFAGKYPISTGLLKHGVQVTKKDVTGLADLKFIAEILKSDGYNTYALDWLSRWYRRGFDFYLGFFDYIDKAFESDGKKKAQPKKESKFRSFIKRTLIPQSVYALKKKREFLYNLEKNPYIENAQKISERAVKIIEEQKEPFFLFMHFWDTHSPYNPPEKYLEEKKGYFNNKEDIKEHIGNNRINKRIKNLFYDTKTINKIIAKYEGEVRFIDSQIKNVIEALEKNKLIDDTIIIITGDHGESFIEHGILFDHHGLYDQSTHVPLIFHCPKRFKPSQIDSLVQHVDLLPTIVDILKIKDEFNFDGKSLIPLIKNKKDKIRDFIFTEEAYIENKRAIRTKNYKYITTLSDERKKCKFCQVIHGENEELYDLKKDPLEVNNLINEEQDIANKLKSLLEDEVLRLKQKNEELKIKNSIKNIKIN